MFLFLSEVETYGGPRQTRGVVSTVETTLRASVSLSPSVVGDSVKFCDLSIQVLLLT